MYAITEACRGRGVGTISRDQHGGEWWRGDRWTPASDEAMTFETAEEAESHAEQHISRAYAVVEID